MNEEISLTEVLAELTERALCTKRLSRPFSSGKIKIGAGCNSVGIVVFEGLEEVSKIADSEIKTELYGDIGARYVEFEGCRFYSPFVVRGNESV